jgi:hypothetical protein
MSLIQQRFEMVVENEQQGLSHLQTMEMLFWFEPFGNEDRDKKF